MLSNYNATSKSWTFSLKVFQYFFVLFFLCFSHQTLAKSVAWDKDNEEWKKQESAHFTISYLSQYQTDAERVLTIAELVHQQLTPFYKVSPKEKTRIVLSDDTDIPVNLSDTLEYGEIPLSMSPPTQVTDIESQDDWFHLYLINAYSQILHFELAAGTLRGMVLSAEFTPYMFIKGTSLYMQNKNGLQSNLLDMSTSEMKMRMEVASGNLRPLNNIIATTKQWPYDAMYIYGAYFSEYLATTYGEDQLLAFLNDYSQHLIHYVFLNQQTEAYFDKEFFDLWDEFQAYLIQRFQPQIDQLTANEVSGERIDSHPVLLPVVADKSGLIMGMVTSEDQNEIRQYNGNKWENITSIVSNQSFDNHDQSGLLLTRTISYTDFHTFNDIFIYKDGEEQRLTERQRFKYVRWMNDGKRFIASRIVKGISELWLFNTDSIDSPELLWRGENNEIIGNFDISPDNQYLVAALKRSLSQWKLTRFDLSQREWTQINQLEGTETTPSFMDNGDILYSADYDNIYNIYRLNSQTQKIEKLTNVIGGAFNPVWQDGLGLVLQSYESEGYVLRYIESPTVISTLENNLSEPDTSTIKTNELAEELSEPEDYSTWETMQSHSLYPVLYADEIRTLVGANTYGADALGRHNYNIYALWDITNQQASYALQYKYDNRWTLAYKQDYKFDNLTPEADEAHYQILKSEVYLMQRNNLFNAWEDQLGFHGGLTYSLDKISSTPTIPSNLTQSTPSEPTKELTLGLAFTFDNREYYRNVPSTGSGHYFDLTYEENILNTDFSGQKYQAQWHYTLDLPSRYTLLTRLSAGYSSDSAKQFSIGGNNLNEEMRLFDRNQQSIRGYDDLAQQGHIYTTQRVELNALINRVERNLGLFPLGMGDIAGKLYVDSGAAWDRGDSPKPLTGLGAQVEVEFILGYNYVLPISLGFAHGLDDISGKNYVYINFGSTY